MVENNPTVSIIIPTYKRDFSILSRAISSAQAQTYSNIEIVVVDDNATEELKLYRNSNVESFEKIWSQDKRIKLVLNDKNLGGALSRNHGIVVSSGKYITFLDDDDCYLPNKIENQISYMLASGCNFSFTDLCLYNEKNELVDIRDRSDIKSFEKGYLLRYHIVKNITGTETFMATKELLMDLGCFDDAITGHEFYLMLKVILSPRSTIGYFKSNDIIAYRTGASSISNGPHKIEGENRIYQKRKEFFNILTLRERRYVRSRHQAVIGITYWSRKKPFKGFLYLFVSFLTSPGLAFKQFFLKKR